jgi:hypothetical protein
MGNISDLTIPEFIYLDDQKVGMALWRPWRGLQNCHLPLRLDKYVYN